METSGLGTNKRVWLGGGALVAVLVALAGWFMVINPQLSAAAANRDQTVAADLQNQALQVKNDDLKEKNGDKGALQAGLAAEMQQLPSNGGLPALTRQLSAQAKAAGVNLTSVTIGAATPLAGASSRGPTTTAAEVTTAAAPTAATAAPTATGLVQMTIAVTTTGLGRSELAFLRAVQWSGPRRALVTAVQLTPVASATAGIDGECTLAMTLNVFSAPLSPSAEAALQKLLSEK